MWIRFLKDESAQTMVEYGLIIGLLSMVIMGVLVLLGPRIAGSFTVIDNQLAAAPGA